MWAACKINIKERGRRRGVVSKNKDLSVTRGNAILVGRQPGRGVSIVHLQIPVGYSIASAGRGPASTRWPEMEASPSTKTQLVPLEFAPFFV